MPRTPLQTAADRRTELLRRVLLEEARRLIDDAGISQTSLARTAGVTQSQISRFLAGTANPSLGTINRLAAALGAELSVHLYPNTGPLVRDRDQATMLEAVLRDLHPRWHPFTEVAVRRPSRGWIDLALHDPAAALVVATELQSELRRLEQIVRWSAEKAAGLPSWEGWTALGSPATSRLLVVRRTRATREVATTFARQLRVAYPAHPDDALAAISRAAPWPGPAMLWAEVTGARTRLIGRR